jgi:hypothetical protein
LAWDNIDGSAMLSNWNLCHTFIEMWSISLLIMCLEMERAGRARTILCHYWILPSNILLFDENKKKFSCCCLCFLFFCYMGSETQWEWKAIKRQHKSLWENWEWCCHVRSILKWLSHWWTTSRKCWVTKRERNTN